MVSAYPLGLNAKHNPIIFLIFPGETSNLKNYRKFGLEQTEQRRFLMFYKPQYNTETQTSDNNTENDCDLRHRQKDAQMHSKGRHRILPTRSKGRPIYIGTQAKDLAPGVIFCNAQARARSQKGRDISRSEESKMKDATMTHCLVWS